MSLGTLEIPVVVKKKKAGRPKAPAIRGDGKQVRLDPDVVAKAKMIATRKNLEVGPYLSSLLEDADQPGVHRAPQRAGRAGRRCQVRLDDLKEVQTGGHSSRSRSACRTAGGSRSAIPTRWPGRGRTSRRSCWSCIGTADGRWSTSRQSPRWCRHHQQYTRGATGSEAMPRAVATRTRPARRGRPGR